MRRQSVRWLACLQTESIPMLTDCTPDTSVNRPQPAGTRASTMSPPMTGRSERRPNDPMVISWHWYFASISICLASALEWLPRPRSRLASFPAFTASAAASASKKCLDYITGRWYQSTRKVWLPISALECPCSSARTSCCRAIRRYIRQTVYIPNKERRHKISIEPLLCATWQFIGCTTLYPVGTAVTFQLKAGNEVLYVLINIHTYAGRTVGLIHPSAGTHRGLKNWSELIARNVASGRPSHYSSCGRVARSVQRFPPNCLQKLARFNIPAKFTLGY